MFRAIGRFFGWIKRMLFTPVVDSPGGDIQERRLDLTNDFDFETELGEFLAHGYEAHYNEGKTQGKDDPSKNNYKKQTELLSSRLNNRIDREILVKKNKLEIYESAISKTSVVLTEEIEYDAKKIRLQNDLVFINNQKDLVKEKGGWYIILEEALHDGFQDGAKLYFEEFNAKNSL